MAVGVLSNYSASRRALNKALLDKIRLQNILDCAPLFTQCGSNTFRTHWTAIKLFDDGHQQATIKVVKTVLVDTQHIEGKASDLFIYQALSLNFTKITHTTEKTIGDAGSST